MTRKKTLTELRHEYKELRTRATEMLSRADGQDLSGDEATEFEELAQALEAIREEVERGEAAIASLTEAAGKPGQTEKTPSVAPRRSSDGNREMALRSIERQHKTGNFEAREAERAEAMLNSGPARGRDFNARMLTVTSSDAYAEAFVKMAIDPATGASRFTAEEAAAWRAGGDLMQEARASMAIGAPSTGGSLVPSHLNPNVVLTNDSQKNDLLSLARQETISVSSYNAVTSEGATSFWKAELEASTPGEPTFGPENIPLHKANTWVRWSIEQESDAAGAFLSQIKDIIRESANDLISQAIATGSGDGEPTGLLTALLASANPDIVVDHLGEALDEESLYRLQRLLAPRWTDNARFIGSLGVFNEYRRMTNEAGNWSFPELRNSPPTLLNRSIAEVSHLDAVPNPDTDATTHPILFGDLKQLLVVRHSVAAVELVPHVMNSSGIPLGQRGFYLHQRVGSDVLVPKAFRVLELTTAEGAGEGEGETE